MESTIKREWFETWFDSKYYEILYRHRDNDEAADFLDNVIQKLKPKPEAKILDVACGMGRHSQYLSAKNFDVTGIDLSRRNIKHNREFETEKLSFYEHDMRQIFRINYFDLVLNLFTSFGYFEKVKDNTKAMRAMTSAVKPGGFLLMDYMNTNKVVAHLSPMESKSVEGVNFEIKREIEGCFIWKHILIEDNGEKHHFAERVEAFTSKELTTYFEEAGLENIQLFGDYSLNIYDPQTSPRLILIGQKKN